jgi:hypothetical protein
MALGGARTAGSAFGLLKDKRKQINDLLLSRLCFDAAIAEVSG